MVILNKILMEINVTRWCVLFLFLGLTVGEPEAANPKNVNGKFQVYSWVYYQNLLVLD